MNFKEWFNKKYGNGDHPAKITAKYLTRTGWVACRKEVLKMLIDENCDCRIVEKIKKLLT